MHGRNKPQSRTNTIAIGLALLMIASPILGQSSARDSFHTWSGEELFVGLFFGEGKVGQLFPEIWGGLEAHAFVEPELEARSKAIRDGVVQRVWTADPTFFPRFATAIQSGHRLVISEILDEGSHLLLDALLVELNMDAEEFERNRCSAGSQRFIIGPVAIAIAAVAVVAVVVTAVAFWDVFDGGCGTNSALDDDRFVDLIAQRLVATPATR